MGLSLACLSPPALPAPRSPLRLHLHFFPDTLLHARAFTASDEVHFSYIYTHMYRDREGRQARREGEKRKRERRKNKGKRGRKKEREEESMDLGSSNEVQIHPALCSASGDPRDVPLSAKGLRPAWLEPRPSARGPGLHPAGPGQGRTSLACGGWGRPCRRGPLGQGPPLPDHCPAPAPLLSCPGQQRVTQGG